MTDALDLLRSVSLFSDLDEADLVVLCEGSEETTVGAGEELFSEGDFGDDAYVVVDGVLEVTKHSANRDVLVAVRHRGDVIGEMAPLESAILDAAPRSATIRARTDARLLVIKRENLEQVLDTSPKGARAMFGVLLRRWRETESLVRHSDKMAQLGTLSAGLAHEINNPASAVKRAADDLPAAIESYASARQAAADLPEGVTALIDRIAAGDPPVKPPTSPIARSDAEAAIEEWLEARGIADPWSLAPALVAAGVDAGVLDGLDVDDDRLATVAELLAAAAGTHDLIRVVTEGAGRVSSLVKSMKDYAYLDRAPVQDVVVTEGIEDTLLILRSKLKDIEVITDFDDVPAIPAHGSELNQVWTNLIDNAIDAVTESGGSRITVRAMLDGDTIAVEVADDGGGIPPDVQPRIFDAFFTTKPPGKGTGQGLGITFGIVAQRHGGNIFVKETGPEGTTFRVELPTSGPPD